MTADLTISRASALPQEIDRLVELSLGEGLRFVRRLRDEWRSGANRFVAGGEAFLVARLEGRLVGFCGLNRDPYCADPAVGRLRHLYVVPEARRRGVGRAIVGRALSLARHRFRVVRLRTDTVGADRFYRAIGFTPTPDAADATHERRLTGGADLQGSPA